MALHVLTQTVYRQATTNSLWEWQYHMLHVYNCILLKMSTWGSKHLEESIILWINNNQCIKVGNFYIDTLDVFDGNWIFENFLKIWFISTNDAAVSYKGSYSKRSYTELLYDPSFCNYFYKLFKQKMRHCFRDDFIVFCVRNLNRPLLAIRFKI